jgi:hypothetical protein
MTCGRDRQAWPSPGDIPGKGTYQRLLRLIGGLHEFQVVLELEWWHVFVLENDRDGDSELPPARKELRQPMEEFGTRSLDLTLRH